MFYDFADALQHTAVDRPKIQRWCDAGIIQTSGGGSQGKRREFSFRNLIELVVCDELHGLGVNEASMRRVVKDLNTIWNQPDELTTRDPQGPKYREASILWLALQHYDESIGDQIATYPITPADLVSRLTDGAVDGSFVAESGIAIPIGRIIADLERTTKEIFDLEGFVLKKLREARLGETPKKDSGRE